MSDFKDHEIGFNIQDILANKLGKDLLAYLPAKILPAVIAFISIPIFTRLFPPEDYGLYTLFISGASLAASLLFGWLSQASLRFFDEYKMEDKKNYYLSTVFITWLFLVLITYIIVGLSYFLLGEIIKSDLIYFFILSTFIVGSHSLYTTIKMLLRASRSSILFALMSVLMPLGRLITVLLLVYYSDFGVESLLVGTFSFELILSLTGLIYFKPKIKLAYFNKEIFRRSLKYGIPLMFTTLLTWVLSTSDRYILGFYHDTESVGIYSIAYNLGSQSIQLIFMAIMLGAFPVIIQTWNKFGKEKTEKLINELIRYYLIFTIPAVVGMSVISKPFLSVITTEGYIEGYTLLPWITLGIFFMGLSQYTNKAWELTEKTHIFFSLNGIAALANLTLNFILIPIYGAVAAALTTLISYFLYVAISLLMSQRYFKLSVNLSSVAKIAFSSLLMGIIVYLTSQLFHEGLITLILLIVTGAVTYLLLLILVGEARREFNFIWNKFVEIKPGDSRNIMK